MRNFSLRASASRRGKQKVADCDAAVDECKVDIFREGRWVFHLVSFFSKFLVINDQLSRELGFEGEYV